MAGDLDRDGIIGLLESLGSERDEDVLEAAREIHAQVTAAGVTWDVLLAPDAAAEDEAPGGTAEEEDEAPGGTAEEEDEAPDAAAEEEDEDAAAREEADGEDAQFAEADGEDAAPAPARDRGNKESLALIARLLAKSDISKDMREELQGYKEDIAEGEFEDMDRKYLRALHARLTKRR
ncbi:MAG: hypothetical protein IH925_08305 [Proteobacteria bacterium]|nr:hypothetical protein [Pseudomonadota bacterium]